MKKITLLVGFGAGYVLGAQAGRERYEQIVALADRTRQRPEVQHVAEVVKEKAVDLETKAKDAVEEKVLDLTTPITAL